MKINLNLLCIVLFITTPIHARTWQQYLAIQYNYLMQKMTGNYAYILNTTKSRIPYDEFMRPFYNQLKDCFDKQAKNLIAKFEEASFRNDLNQKLYKAIKLIANSPYSEKIAKNFKTYFPHFFYARDIKIINPNHVFNELTTNFALIKNQEELRQRFQDMPGVIK